MWHFLVRQCKQRKLCLSNNDEYQNILHNPKSLFRSHVTCVVNFTTQFVENKCTGGKYGRFHSETRTLYEILKSGLRILDVFFELAYFFKVYCCEIIILLNNNEILLFGIYKNMRFTTLSNSDATTKKTQTLRNAWTIICR